MKKHDINSLIKDHAPFIKRADDEFQRLCLKGKDDTDYNTLSDVVDHLSTVLSCYIEITELSAFEINSMLDLLTETQVQLIQLARLIPHAIWLLDTEKNDPSGSSTFGLEFNQWAQEQSINVLGTISCLPKMECFVLDNEQSVLLAKIRYGRYVLDSNDPRLN